MVGALDGKPFHGIAPRAVVRTRSLSTPIGPMRAVAATHCGVDLQSRGECLAAQLLELRTESAAGRFGSAVSSELKRDTQRFIGLDFEASVQVCEELLTRTTEQLEEYFRGHRFEFDLPVALGGTAFQLNVWTQLLRIGYAHTQTYAQLASLIGAPKGFRAVGAALGRNPLWIILPCHRVVGKTGKLVGFAGGLDIKRYLIELEKKHATG